MKAPETLQPDSRWENFAADRSDLARRANGWRVSDAVPEGVSEVLRIARELFVHSYFVYEFSLTAVIWGLLALEATLRDCLNAPDRTPLAHLIREAETAGLLSATEAAAIDAGRQLRNRIVHGYLLPVYTPGIAGEMLEATHEAVSDLYERAAGQAVETLWDPGDPL